MYKLRCGVLGVIVIIVTHYGVILLNHFINVLANTNYNWGEIVTWALPTAVGLWYALASLEDE